MSRIPFRAPALTAPRRVASVLRRPLQLLLLTLASLVVFPAPRSEAMEIMIDDFTDAQGPTSTSATDSYSYLFLYRTIGIQPPDGSGEIEVDSDLDALIVTNLTGDPFQGVVYWPLIPLSDGMDVHDGTNDRFELGVGGVSGTWTAQMSVTQGATSAFSAAKALMDDTDLEFLFSEFDEIDFTQLVNEVALILTNSSEQGESAVIYHVTAVPEPGTASLLGLGLLGLAAVGSPARRGGARPIA
jgi:hypothetical protein